MQDIAHVVTDANGRALRMRGVLLDVTAQQRGAQAKDLLAQAGRIQSRADPLHARLAALTRAAVPLLADFAVVALRGPDGLLHPHVVAHLGRPGLEAEILRGPGFRMAEDLVERCAVGRPFVVDTPAELGLPHLAEASTVLMVPLLGSAQRILGVLNFVSTDRTRQYPPFDLDLADEVGQRAALMIESDRVANRERQLHQMTVALAAADGVQAAARALTVQVRGLVGARASAVLLLEPDRGLRLVHQSGYPPDLADKYRHIPLSARSPAVDCVRTGGSVWLHDSDEWRARYPSFSADRSMTGDSATAFLPLHVMAQNLGVLVVSFPDDREFARDERAFLRTIAGQASAAFERAELADTRRHVADTLQRSLLPAALPELGTIALAARYLSATDGIAAGGDWYDVMELDADRTAIMVGDVVGHGAAAAAIMGQLRSVLSSSLLRGDAPMDALEHLDRFVAGFPERGRRPRSA